MRFWPAAAACVIFSSFTNAGVERLISPISFFDNGDRDSITKKSALYSNSFTSKPLSSVRTAKPFFLDQSTLESKLSHLLQHRYQVHGKVRAFLGREWVPLQVSHNFQIKIRDSNPDELTASTYTRFSVWDKGERLGDFSMPLKLSHLQGVFFSKIPLQRGAIPSPSSFETKEVDVLKNHANSVPATAKLSGYQIDSNLKPGQPLKWNLLSKTTLIRKGEVVDVFASGNGIFVTMKGLALEDGVRDSMVRIKNINSEKEFRAKVLDESSVKVHL